MITLNGIRNLILSALLLLPASAFAYGPATCDFDGDGKADQTIVRNDAGNNKLDWWVRLSNTGAVLTFPWGLSSDFSGANKLLCGDFDGDGQADATIWRQGASDGEFWVRLTAGGVLHQNFGLPGDDPTVINDYDGDGIDDFAIWRPGVPAWFWIRQSSNGALIPRQWGTGLTDFAHAQDFDHDGKADLYAQRTGFTLSSPSQNWILNSATSTLSFSWWGLSSDVFSSLDYTGDGRADIMVPRVVFSNTRWYLRDTATGTQLLDGTFGIPWGPSTGRTLVPADYDGDGKADLAVWLDGSGQWWIRNSQTSSVSIIGWGITGDAAINGFEVK